MRSTAPIMLHDPAARARLRAARRAARLTQAAIARQIGVGRSTYHRFERGVGALTLEQWQTLTTILPIEGPAAPTAPTSAPIGAQIADARRRRRLRRSDVADSLRTLDPTWTAARLKRVETGQDPWPVAGCAALTRILGLDPAVVGLAPVSPVQAIVPSLLWTAFYAAPTAAPPLLPVLASDVSPLLTSDDGLWTLQALGVTIRDQGHLTAAWQVLSLAAQGAAASDSPDLRAAAALRLARAARDAGRSASTEADRRAWLRQALQQITHATTLAAWCRLPLQTIIHLTDLDIRLAIADPAVTGRTIHTTLTTAMAMANRHPGRDPLSGVTLHPTGVLHMVARALVDASGTATTSLPATILHDLDAASADAGLPPRWRPDLSLTLAQGWLATGRPDHASATLADALLDHASWSPKQRRRGARVLALLPDPDVRADLQALLDLDDADP
jgi:transcriptional regulator with XRE-family HTH domain